MLFEEIGKKNKLPVSDFVFGGMGYGMGNRSLLRLMMSNRYMGLIVKSRERGLYWEAYFIEFHSVCARYAKLNEIDLSYPMPHLILPPYGHMHVHIQVGKIPLSS